MLLKHCTTLRFSVMMPQCDERYCFEKSKNSSKYLGRELYFKLSQIVIDLLPTFLIRRSTNRPNNGKQKPQFSHTTIVIRILPRNLGNQINIMFK